MKSPLVLLLVLTPFFSKAQNIQVDSQTFTPQQLIEDILINNNCITNVIVKNVVGGDFNNLDQSYGYFDATGTSFPFKEGIVLSTGRLANVQGPNITLSDDDAPNWIGDADLESELNASNTTNATILEFEFTSITSQISFRYIFASEEYQENNANTCLYSDSFGFLIKPVNSTQYTNIALVPNTQTPVRVTTVHPTIPNGCVAQNELYFESWNDVNAPINFNGQTKILTATANVVPNETYHVKLVIADEQNYRYDSAVFLEAGSFQLSTDLGEDRLFATNNPLCGGETLVLEAFTQNNNVTYKWFKDSVELSFETNSTYSVTEAGIYNVEVTLDNSCISYGEIIIEYSKNINARQNFLSLCDNDQDGITFFNLHLADPFYFDEAENNEGYTVTNFYLTEQDAFQGVYAIPNPESFINTVPNQVVYARIENKYGCFLVRKLSLSTGYTSSSVKSFTVCDDDVDGYAIFDLNELRTQIQPEVSQGSEITFYSGYDDAAKRINQLDDNYLNITPFSQDIYVIAEKIFCSLFTTITLKVDNKPKLLPNQEEIYCSNNYPEPIKINAGLVNASSNETYTYQWEKDGFDLGINNEEIEVNESGNYTVTAINSSGCSSERTINVELSGAATIDDIIVEELNNSISVVVSGEGVYEYALDTSSEGFQQSNVFYNVTLGSHTVFVRDINGCGLTEKQFSISGLFGFPKFFTPNNDGEHDTWNPFASNIYNSQISDVFIFDRYGKLIKTLTASENGWDGTHNGIPLPSSDYWYKVVFEDRKSINGHFTLKR